MAARPTRAISEKTDLSLDLQLNRSDMDFDKNTCRVCGDPIVIQIFKGTGIGSENCRKIFEKESDGHSDR
jgi:hypothetical protein